MVTRRALAIGAGVSILALAGCGSSPAPSTTQPSASVRPSAPSPTPSPTALSTAQVASMVRTLYYGEEQAYQISLRRGFAYQLAHDYPGSVSKRKFLACAATYETQNPGGTISGVPEVGTLAPDPTWVGPPGGKKEPDWLFAGQRPNGQTFILTVDYTYTAASGQQSTSKDQVHVTIWNGNAYYYNTICPG